MQDWKLDSQVNKNYIFLENLQLGNLKRLCQQFIFYWLDQSSFYLKEQLHYIPYFFYLTFPSNFSHNATRNVQKIEKLFQQYFANCYVMEIYSLPPEEKDFAFLKEIQKERWRPLSLQTKNSK